MTKRHTVRKATIGDAPRVLEIRNHPTTRAASLQTDEIPWERHAPWFERTYLTEDAGHSCFVVETEGIVVGYCRYDTQDDGIMLVSIAVDPEFRGQGIGASLLSESLATITEKSRIIAEILKRNDASLNLFIRNGFSIIDEDDVKYRLCYGSDPL